MGIRDFMLSINERWVACMKPFYVKYENTKTWEVEINQRMNVSINAQGWSAQVTLLWEMKAWLFNWFDSKWQSFHYWDGFMEITNPSPTSIGENYKIEISKI